MITLESIITLGICLITAGFWGIFVARKTIIHILISLELLLLGVGFGFIVFSVYLNDIIGQVVALLLLVVAGTESVIGLALVLSLARLRDNITVPNASSLKG